jgi:hypothetical protein
VGRIPCFIASALILSFASSANSATYTLSQQGILALDITETDSLAGDGVSVIRTPVANGVEYLVTFTSNAGFVAGTWSYPHGGRHMLTGLPLVNGDSLALKYTLLSSTSSSGTLRVGPAIDYVENGCSCFSIAKDARLGGGAGTSVTATVATNHTGQTTYVGSFLFVLDAVDRSTWPATGGQIRVLVSAVPGVTVLGPPALPLYVSSTELRYQHAGSAVTRPQTVQLTGNSSAVTWCVTTNEPWIAIANACGTGSGSFTVSVNPAGLTGTHTGELVVTATGYTDIQVIQVIASQVPKAVAPYGTMDTPIEGAAVQGAIGVTGWALDDIEVVRVRIFRDPVGTELPNDPNGVFIGDAVFTEGVRPDVAGRYSTHPLRTRSGWGLQVLTNMLPQSAGHGPRGNGTYTFRAVASDAEGNSTTLGERNVTVNNTSATKPFGTIDTPAPGATISGSYFVVFGWALTPGTAKIPENGSTIMVYIDGRAVGRPIYNQKRQDIMDLFPGYTNTEGAVGYYILDSRALSNGMHNIAWSVTDTQGHTEGIGSRYFFVHN